MVSARPSPAPARGRIAYPAAGSYTPGDAGVAPTTSPPPGPGSTSRVASPLPVPVAGASGTSGFQPSAAVTTTSGPPATGGAAREELLPSDPAGTAGAGASGNPSSSSTNPPIPAGSGTTPNQPALGASPSTGSGSSGGATGGASGALRRLRSVRSGGRDKSREKSRERERGERAEQREARPISPAKPSPIAEMSEREQSTQGLRTWWKSFSQRQSLGGQGTSKSLPAPPMHQAPNQSFRHAPRQTMTTRRVFGVSLAKVIADDYAGMQISKSGPDGKLIVWGTVPIVVARCGGYLKDRTDIEGIFRISGSTKRMRELQAIFDEGPSYGMNIDWEASNFTPHDVATILRRYLTQMPEPVIPVQFYSHFRNVQASDMPTKNRIREYRSLIRSMPTANQYLLLYLLDLLGIFAKESDKNLMTAANLAVVFQPGMLSHPGHEMRPLESAPSKEVIEFLIENHRSFVFGRSMPMSHHDRKEGVSRKRRSSVSSQTRRGSASSQAGQDTKHKAQESVSTHSRQDSTASVKPPDSKSKRQRPPKDQPAVDSATRPSTDSVRPTTDETFVATEETTLVGHGPKGSQPQPSQTVLPPQSPTSQSASPQPQPSKTISSPLPSPGIQSSTTPRVPSPLRVERPERPAPVRADTDYMLPSDSDDEAPSGGYYIVEAEPRTSLSRPTSPAALSPVPLLASAVASLIPSRPTPKHGRKPRPSLPSLPSRGGVPTIDLIDPSDSDEDTPTAGYIMYENRRGLASRHADSPVLNTTASSPTPTTSHFQPSAFLQRSRTALQPADARTNSPKPPGADPPATDLRRRATLPAKRRVIPDFIARRRAAREV